MKKYSLLLILAFSLFSCKDFLEETQVTALTHEFYNTVEGLESLNRGTYQIFRFKPDYNAGHYLFGTCSDVEVFAWTNADRRAMGSYIIDGWDPGSALSAIRMAPMVNTLLGAEGGNLSEGAYPTISRCNIFFERYALMNAADQNTLRVRYGEMLFMRAYAYFLLTNVLGDVPLILKSFPNVPSVFFFPRTPMETIYKRIIADLQMAIPMLPNTAPTGQLGRITAPAANHFLAKLYLVRAQGAQFQNDPEPTLKALYKGSVGTDLDSAIYYATQAINLVAPTNAATGGLSPDFGSLWTNITGDFSRDFQKEILLAAQYEFTQTLNGRYGNTLVHLYNSNYTLLRSGVTRNLLDYGRPYATAGPTDWGSDVFTDRANDSRFYKTFLTEYLANDANVADPAKNPSKPWDAPGAFYFNQRLKPAGSADVVVGKPRINAIGQRAIVYIENAKSEPLDSLWVISQPYILMARWIVGSPNNAGYFTYDANKNITGFKPGADIDPANPVVSNPAGRKIIYRLSGDNGSQFGIDQGDNPAGLYISPRKWLDRNRGGGTVANNAGAINVTLMRLAETYLIRAEAYGRKGMYSDAINDINVLRKRASYHVGENRPEVLVTVEPGVLTGRLNIPAAERVAPFTVQTDSYAQIMVDGTEWVDGSPRALKENYYPGARDLFVEFIYNERARELIFELLNVEDLHNAGILYERVYYRDMMGAPPASTGTAAFPFAKDDISVGAGTVGARGVGKGNLLRTHTFKPWPISYLKMLTDENGRLLTPEAMQAYQNHGF